MRCDFEASDEECEGVAVYRVWYDFADGTVERFVLCRACCRAAVRDARGQNPDVESVGFRPLRGAA